jgi:hypothetical protein
MLRPAPAPPARLCVSGARLARHAAASAAPQDAACGARTARAAGASLSRRAASERDVVCDAERGDGGNGGSEPHAGSRSGNGNGNGGSSSAGNGVQRNLADVASAVGDDFWRDGGGFPHYLQSKARACLALPCTRLLRPAHTPGVRARQRIY